MSYKTKEEYFNSDQVSYSQNNELLFKENNPILIKDLKNKIDNLEREKLELIRVVSELKEKVTNLNIAKDEEKIKQLEKERDNLKDFASNNFSMCSKMAEELIVLRNRFDKFNYDSNK